MKRPTQLLQAALMVAAAGWGPGLLAQGPVSDQVIVTFPNPVMVGNQRIEAGEYLIRQLPSASNPRILEFSSNNGTKVQATIASWAALDNLNRHDTKVDLDSANGAQYVRRVWVAGQPYGYVLPAPNNNMGMQEASNQSGVRITGSYRPQQVETAQARQTPPPATTQPEPTPAPATPPPATTTEAQTPRATDNADTQTTAPAPTPAPAAAQQETTTAPQTATPRTTMPATAANWSGAFMGGLLILGAGLFIHRFHRA